MENKLIQGNTSQKITITNNNDYSFNVTWYTTNPNPADWIRPNRTFIPDLSWVDVEPKYIVISAEDKGVFYIHLNLPEIEEIIDKKWEIWVVFKPGIQQQGNGFFSYEHAVRVYIDTPSELNIDNNIDKPGNNDEITSAVVDDNSLFPALNISLVIVFFIVLIVGFILYKKKKQ